jgi:L-cysteine/cystine lyase
MSTCGQTQQPQGVSPSGRDPGSLPASGAPSQRERQDERTKVDAIRQELPATLAFAYLNAGTNGPLPRRSHEALVAFDRADLMEGRIGPQGFSRYFQTLTDAREVVADLLGCQPLDVALTHNTTEGVNIAVMGIDWRPGDEVITAATEHPGVLHPVYLLHQRFGVRIRMTEIGSPDRDPLAELRRALTPRTRAVVVSHVSWASGMVLPIREMADLAHHHGALLIADAAQSCGMVPSPVYELGVDAYACSGQKWLCGPNGTGALFVRQDRLGDIHQTFMGYGSIHHGMSDYEGHFVPAPGAKRFEAAALYPAGVKAFETGLRWLRVDVGWEWIYERIAALGRYCYDALAAVDGVTLLTPRDHVAGLVHFNREGIAPADLAAKLAEGGVVVRSTPHPPAVRASLGFYNTQEEVDRLVEAVRHISG